MRKRFAGDCESKARNSSKHGEVIGLVGLNRTEVFSFRPIAKPNEFIGETHFYRSKY